MAQMAACLESEERPVLGWSSQEWELHGEVQYELRKVEDLCPSSDRTFTFFPRRYTLEQAIHFCQVVGGALAVPRTPEENALVYESSKDVATYCSGEVGASYLWLGVNDEAQERTWAYWSSGEPVTWENTWRGTGPNGGIAENCLVMLHGAYPGYWSDIACLDSYAFCVPCEFEEPPLFHLKGPAMCEESPFNRQYMIGELQNGQPSLRGFFHTDMYWNSTEEVWVMESLKVGTTAMFSCHLLKTC